MDAEKNHEEKKVSSRETHLLEAILHLLLFIGTSGDEPYFLEKIKKLVFTSGVNPPTDYGRPKVLMGG